MKIGRSFKLTKRDANHAPWGNLAKPAKGLIDEAGIEFFIRRDDFKLPDEFDAIFASPQITCYAVCSRVSSEWGCEVNNRWVFAASSEEIEKFRQSWINHRDLAGYDHCTTLSQANAQQWMSSVLIDALKQESLPDVPASLLNS